MALKKLLAKHIPTSTAGSLVSEGSVALQALEYVKSVVAFSNTGRKAVQKLTVLQKKRVDEFLETINEKGLQGLRDNQSKWHLKQLKRNPHEHTY